MALSQILELTSGPAVVQQLGFTSPLASPVIAMRGTLPVAIQVASSGVATALPTGAMLYYGVKTPGAIKGDWLAQCQLTASTDPDRLGLWTGTLLLNTPEMRAAMHAELSDPVAELLTLDCLAEPYYTLPGQADPVCALNLNFTVNSPLFNGTEGIAPSPNLPYPSSAKVCALVAPYQVTATSGTVMLPADTRFAVQAAVQAGDLLVVLPLSTGYANGTILTFQYTGNGTYPVEFTVQGDDSLNGNSLADGPPTIALPPQGGYLTFYSNGAGDWFPALAPTGFVLHRVATNDDKLAVASQSGDHFIVEEEGYRVEQFVNRYNDDPDSDPNYVVLANTLYGRARNTSDYDVTINGVNVPADTNLYDVGWFSERSLTIGPLDPDGYPVTILVRSSDDVSTGCQYATISVPQGASGIASIVGPDRGDVYFRL